MSWLYPLYALAGLSALAPLLFHFWRRRPMRQQPFSSLMFLDASPPQQPRRSRLNQPLLLLLRVGALLLIAMAFTRPFWRSAELVELNAATRSVILLIDCSGSMRRAGLDEAVTATAEAALEQLRPSDQVCLMQFADATQTLVSFEQWNELPVGQRLAHLRQKLGQLQPSWQETQLGQALAAAADRLMTQSEQSEQHAMQIVLISDLQSGADWAALQATDWPAEVKLDIRQVRPQHATDATVQLLPATAETEQLDSSDDRCRVLVRNAATSQRAQFQLHWEVAEKGAVVGAKATPIQVHVPPGETHTTTISATAATLSGKPAGKLILTGDDEPLGNAAYFTRSPARQLSLIYVGPDDGPDGLLYFLQRVPLDNAWQQVTLRHLPTMTAATPVDSLDLDATNTPLVVVGGSLDQSATERMVDYAEAGGRVLLVLDDRMQNEAQRDAMQGCLRRLLPAAQVTVAPASAGDTAQGGDLLLSEIDFQHPIFSAMSGPRYSDFSKIRFWRHCHLQSSEPAWQCLARFDNGHPALVQQTRGQGSVLVLTSGWQPQQSQLGLSSKFIPLVSALFAGPVTEPNVETLYVGQPIVVGDAPVAGDGIPTPTPTRAGISADDVQVVDPAGGVHSLSGDTHAFSQTNQPGVYTVQRGTEQRQVAVNVHSSELELDAVDPTRFESLGVPLRSLQAPAKIQTQQRQLKNQELEGQQKLWRWALLAGLALIGLETLYATRLSRADLSLTAS